jgi:GNAT superfamily N-acetyltransferase
MTSVSRERPTAATRADYSITQLSDPAVIRRLLEPQRSYTAYALAQLDPRMFPRNKWYHAAGPNGEALLLHSKSPLGSALFALGDATAIDAALSLHPGPRFAFGSLMIEHKSIARKYFLMTRPQLMLRMTIDRDTFQPTETTAHRLARSDIGAVNRLYSLEGGPTAYRKEHLEDAVYYGIFEGPDLISIAGTHVISEAERIAVVGNVFTHPQYRGRGLAKATTSAVSRALLTNCDLVALTVEEANTAAVAVYSSLGYETKCKLHETPLVRKEPIGVVSFVRRAIAGWRGRREGKEVVTR